MKFLLVFAVAAACLNGITSFAVDFGAPLRGSFRKLQETELGNRNDEDGGAEALETKDYGLHSLHERIENTTNEETVKTNSQKSKPGEMRRDEEAGKVVVKRNTGESNTTSTTKAASSISTTQAPVQITFPTPLSQQQAILLTNYLQHGNSGFQPGLLAHVPVPYGLPQGEQKTEAGKKTDNYDYTNIVAILSGGGLVSVAKAIQTLFSRKKEKKAKEKKGRRGRRDSESSNSDSESEAEQAEPKASVAVQIEMKTQTSIEPTLSQKKIESPSAQKKIDSPPVQKKIDSPPIQKKINSAPVQKKTAPAITD